MAHEVMLPDNIVYGLGSFAEVGRLAKDLGTKAFLISDAVMEKIGHVDACRRYVTEAGVEVGGAYCQVNTEPTDRHVAEALALCRESESDLVVAVGGGSCIDAAKAVAVMMTNEGSLRDYAGTAKRFEHRPLPLIAVPTTAGTGSEVTKVTVIIDTERDIKMMISRPELLPKAAVVDAKLSLSCPKSVTAASGIDALCHALEAYLSKKAHPVTDVWALKAIGLLMEHLPTVYASAGQEEAQAEVALGAMLAGAAFSNASVTLVHGMSRPIGALFHVPHGISNAMLLPAVLEFTLGHAEERLARIGRIMRPESAGAAQHVLAQTVLDEVKKLCAALDIPNLRRWGIDPEAFRRALPKMAADAIASGSPANHPRSASAEQIERLYLVCYDYELDRTASQGDVSCER